MVDGKVIKRAKYKSSVKDSGTPGILEMVILFQALMSIHSSLCISTYPGTHMLMYIVYIEGSSSLVLYPRHGRFGNDNDIVVQIGVMPHEG